MYLLCLNVLLFYYVLAHFFLFICDVMIVIRLRGYFFFLGILTHITWRWSVDGVCSVVTEIDVLTSKPGSCYDFIHSNVLFNSDKKSPRSRPCDATESKYVHLGVVLAKLSCGSQSWRHWLKSEKLSHVAIFEICRTSYNDYDAVGSTAMFHYSLCCSTCSETYSMWPALLNVRPWYLLVISRC